MMTKIGNKDKKKAFEPIGSKALNPISIFLILLFGFHE